MKILTLKEKKKCEIDLLWRNCRSKCLNSASCSYVKAKGNRVHFHVLLSYIELISNKITVLQ